MEAHDAFYVETQRGGVGLQTEKGVHREDVVLGDHADEDIGNRQAELLGAPLVAVDQVAQVQADHGGRPGDHVAHVSRYADPRVLDVITELARRETAEDADPGDDDGRNVHDLRVLRVGRGRPRQADQDGQDDQGRHVRGVRCAAAITAGDAAGYMTESTA